MINTTLDGVLNIIYAIASVPVAYYAYGFKKYHIDGAIKKNGLLFKWDNPSSFANPPPKQYIHGHRWSDIKQIKENSKANKAKNNSVFINNFRFFNTYVHEARFPFFLKRIHEKTQFFLDAGMLCRSMLVVGSAGSGKTELFHNILQQKWYKKAIIFEKKFDFTPVYFRSSDIDKVVNPTLKIGAIHNILDEDMEYCEVFMESLTKAALGDKSNDFFGTSARQKVQLYLQEVKLESQKANLTISQKWEMLLNLFEQDFKKAQTGKQNSQKDVMSTVKNIFDSLYLMAYRIIETEAPTFTAKDFYANKKENGKIFLSATTPDVEGLVAATYSVLTKYQLSLPNGWSDFPVLHLQDEYNSLKEMVPERLLVEQREVGRSKMFATLIGVQGLAAETKISQELLINMQYLMVFGGTDSSTLETISKLLGNVEYEHLKSNESFSSQGKSTSYSTQKESAKVLDNYHINILQEEGFSHLFIGLKEKLLFKGYTPQVSINKREYNDFSKIDLNQFYEWKLNRVKKMEQNVDVASAANSILKDLE